VSLLFCFVLFAASMLSVACLAAEALGRISVKEAIPQE
jgi:hypothetical protein